MTLSYRPGRLKDAFAIDRVFQTTFCETFAHMYRDEDLEAFLAKFTLDGWRSELADPAYAFQVVESDGELCGYVKLGPPSLPVEAKGALMELRQFYLSKAQHGSGAAAALMEWAVDEAKRRGMDELYLTVFPENHRARRFYERYGFVTVGRYDFMVGSQADNDLIMMKTL
jgi:GNAT superfamily N-acetyltransferase